MSDEIVNFLNKIKEYGLFEELLSSDSFDWLKYISNDELIELISLSKENFTDKMLMYISKDWSKESRIHDYLIKLKECNNPNIGFVEKIINSYENQLTEYCLKKSINASRKMSIFDFLDLFANAKNLKQAENAYSSFELLIDNDFDNLYEIINTIANSDKEIISDIICSEIQLNHFSFIDLYIKYLPKFKNDIFLGYFKVNFLKHSDYYYNHLDMSDSDALDELFELILKINSCDAYKYSVINEVIGYLYKYNISCENINKILKCDNYIKTKLILECYELVDIEESGSCFFNRNHFISKVNKLTDLIVNIDNGHQLSILNLNVENLFYLFRNNYIEPVDFFNEYSKISDIKDLEEIHSLFKGLYFARTDKVLNYKVKKMKKILKSSNDSTNKM